MWRTRPVFVSSTFQDMHAERDYLRLEVFRELEERLLERRHHLEWVDLRLGVAAASVANEADREREILKVSLAEVRRCRPFLIVLLADRYGWAPPADQVKNAAREAGLQGDFSGRSVTDLEIEFGVFSDPDQQQRTLFYFRDPLPYDEMPEELAAQYSDHHARDPNAPNRVARLHELKLRVERKSPGRIRRYGANWDHAERRVTGFESWTVLDDLWKELADETAAVTVAMEVSWQDAERNALADFAEESARDFVGRKPVLDSLRALALSPIGSENARWGLCLCGEPGSGKSATFGEMYRQLKGSDALLLAHAPGARPQSASVDLMLRRWIEELAAALETERRVPPEATPDQIESAFASLLGLMADKRRIVVMVDALDQFESTTRGRYATWLPRPWPKNARLIATAVPCDLSTLLAERIGVEHMLLPPITAPEARQIIQRICGRYHRTFEPQVFDAILAKSHGRGFAWESPLWLTIAVEELNLLEEGDFRRLGEFTGSPAQQLLALVLDLIERLPTDILDLYRATFARAEARFGVPLVCSFLGLIAVSRAGWRQLDFRALLPRLSGSPWSELRFATLRRMFRGQLRQRGLLGQWNFNHQQMRSAVRHHIAVRGMSESAYHRAVAEHLLSLGRDDTLHESESMVHLLASGDLPGAAQFYADASLTDGELEGATRAMADFVLAPNGTTSARAAHDLTRLFEVSSLESAARITLARRFMFNVSAALAGYAPLEVQAVLANRVTTTLIELLRTAEVTPTLLRLALVSQVAVADVEEALGRHGLAIKIYQRILDQLEVLTEGAPDYVQWLRDRQVAYHRLGMSLKAAIRHDEAIESYRRMLTVATELAAEEPDNGEWPLQICAGYDKLGETLLEIGRNEEADSAIRRSVELAERNVTLHPANANWQSQLRVGYGRLGDVLLAAGRPAEALLEFRKSLVLVERLASENPNDTHLQHDLAVAQSKVGDGLANDRRSDEALGCYRSGLVIFEKLLDCDRAVNASAGSTV